MNLPGMVTPPKPYHGWNESGQANPLTFSHFNRRRFLSKDRSRQWMPDKPKTGYAYAKIPFLETYDACIRGFRINSKGGPRFDSQKGSQLSHHVLAQCGKHATQGCSISRSEQATLAYTCAGANPNSPSHTESLAVTINDNLGQRIYHQI